MMCAITFVKAFERNCPHVRMNNEERLELTRLVREAQKDAEQSERVRHPDVSKVTL